VRGRSRRAICSGHFDDQRLARNGDDRTHDTALSMFRRWRRVEHRRDGAVGADPRRELGAQVDTRAGYLSSADHAADDALGVLGDACGRVSACCLSLLEVARRRGKHLTATEWWPPGGYRVGRRVPQAGHQLISVPSSASIDDRSSWCSVHAWRARWIRIVSTMNCARSTGVVP
jgi:hypothetical protein